jgi:hypothetical protein
MVVYANIIWGECALIFNILYYFIIIMYNLIRIISKFT